MGVSAITSTGAARARWVTWIAGALAVLVGARALWRGSDEEGSSRNLARELGLTLEDATTGAPAEPSGLLEQAFESAFTPASWPQLLFGAYFFVLLAARAESLLGRARVAALLGTGWSVLRVGDSPWLQLPLMFWVLLAAGQYALYASDWGFEPLAPVFAAALVCVAAAAPSVARRWGSRAQPSPSTRL